MSISEQTAQDNGGLPGSEDGRTLRSRRTAAAVAEAMLDLIEEGCLQPTASAVAARASVSARAVFRHFRDMEALFVEACEVQIRRVTRNWVPSPKPEAPLEQRLVEWATRWTTMNERVSPVRRASLLHEASSAAIREKQDWARAAHRAETAHLFAAELKGQSEQRRKELVSGLCAATSWNTWDFLRRYEGLSVEEASRSCLELARGLLAGIQQAG